MVRILAGASAIALLSGCASTPPSPQELIVGAWTCETVSDGVRVDGRVNYLPGGQGDGKVNVAVDAGGVVLDADVVSTWMFLPDGRLEESVTKLTVTSGSLGGQSVPPAMIQSMVEDMIVGQITTSMIAVTSNSLTLTDEDGVTTNCKR